MKGSIFKVREWSEALPVQCARCGVNAQLRQLVKTSWDEQNGPKSHIETYCDACIDVLSQPPTVVDLDTDKDTVTITRHNESKREIIDLFEYMCEPCFKVDGEIYFLVETIRDQGDEALNHILDENGWGLE